MLFEKAEGAVIAILAFAVIGGCMLATGWLVYHSFMEWYYVRDYRSCVTMVLVGVMGVAMLHTLYKSFRTEKRRVYVTEDR